MDGLTVAASIMAVIQLTNTCLKYGTKHFGPSAHNSADLQSISQHLYSLHGILKNLETHLELHEEDAIRLNALGHLQEPLERCAEALKVVEERLKTINSIGKYVVGKHFDGKLRKALRMIEESQKLFTFALHSDHQVILNAVERYIRNIAQDTCGLQEILIENNKRVLSLDNNAQILQKKMKGWQDDTCTEIRKVDATLSNWRSQEEEHSKSKNDQKIVEWLSHLNFWTKQRDALNSRFEGTGSWLLETEQFKDWLDGTKPGAGKTVLAAIVLDHLERTIVEENVAIACIFFKYKEQESQSLEPLIASLVQQLLQKRSSLPEELRLIYKEHEKRKTYPSLERLSTMLRIVAETFSKVYIVIDALDECSDSNGNRSKFIKEMLKHGENMKTMRFLFTSRPMASFESEFTKDEWIEIRASNKDISKYVQDRIRTEPRLIRNVKTDPNLRDAIIDTIVEKANGMFLLASLYMESLARKHNPMHVRKSLETLPEEVNATYDEAMERIQHQGVDDAQLANRVLSWICSARRHLTTNELRVALAVQPGTTSMEENAQYDDQLLIEVCAGLVTVESEGSIIRLVHYTTQEYFEQRRHSTFPTAETDIAIACLTYLCYDDYDTTVREDCPCCRAWDSDEDDPRNQTRNRLLQDYASNYWGEHAREGWIPEVEKLTLAFLDQGEKVALSADFIKFSEVLPSHLLDYREEFPDRGILVKNIAFWISAYFELEKIFDFFRVKGFNVDVKIGFCIHQIKFGGIGFTLLHYFAHMGHTKMVQLLLDNGASVDARVEHPKLIHSYGHNLTPLMSAANEGHVTIVQLLLDNGADIEAKTEFDDTALLLAVQQGYETIVELLLRNGARSDGETPNGMRALRNGAIDGNIRIVQLLLKQCPNIQVRDSSGDSMLHVAAWNGQLEMARYLLEQGADLEARNGRGETPLHRGLCSKRLETVQYLLEQGADIEAEDNDGCTPLHSATKWGFEMMVRHLIEQGANAERWAANFPPLYRAMRSKDIALIQLFLNILINGESKNKTGCVALTEAAWHSQREVLSLVLQTQPNARNFSREYERRTWYRKIYNEIMYGPFMSTSVDQITSICSIIHLLLESGGIDLYAEAVTKGKIVACPEEDRKTATLWLLRSAIPYDHSEFCCLIMLVVELVENYETLRGVRKVNRQYVATLEWDEFTPEVFHRI